MLNRSLSYTQAINEALAYCLATYSNTLLIGEGVPDPKGIFNSTLDLQKKFGKHRVFDMPLAENGMTGVCIGAALTGLRPIMVHQRIDFALLAMDQLINNAAKWFFMFNGQSSVPLVVRLIIGRGWGQGPQHSQSLQALFSHVPGLKVVMPVSAYDAKGMLITAIEDDNPVIFIEHRWLHNVVDQVPETDYRVPLDRANIVTSGSDFTIVAFSLMVVEALKVARVLVRHGISIEVIDMRSCNPLDMVPVVESVRKTGRVMVTDTGTETCGVSSEVITRIIEQAYDSLKCPPIRLAAPNHPVPTSPFLADDYYIDAEQIAQCILTRMACDTSTIEPILQALHRTSPRDISAADYVGPF